MHVTSALGNLLIKAAAPTPRRLLLSAENSPSEGLELELWNLSAAMTVDEVTTGKESVLVVLGGEVEFKVSHHSFQLGNREDVFAGPAAAAYVPAGVPFSLATQTPAEVAVIRAPAQDGLEPYAILPSEVRRESRGAGAWRREVHTILDVDRPARRLIVGETFNPSGGWSSYPPHKHDRQRPPYETQLQELYHYRFQPKQGFGIQRIYSPERAVDDAFVVEHGDSLLIPYGYHPVVGAPGYQLYYLWALAGAARELRLQEDPLHMWVRTGA